MDVAMAEETPGEPGDPDACHEQSGRDLSSVRTNSRFLIECRLEYLNACIS